MSSEAVAPTRPAIDMARVKAWLPTYGVYAAREGHVAVAALEPHFAARLREELGVAELTREALEAALGARTAAEWEAWADQRDLPLAALREPGG